MKRVLVGFAVSLLILGLFLYGVGISDVLSAFGDADLGIFVLGLASAFTALICWGTVWNRVLSVVEHGISRIRIGLIFLSAMFANFITPFGQVGGEPFIALVLSKYTDIDYERALAAIVAADVINLIPFFSYGILGFAYFISRNSLNQTIESYVVAFVLALGFSALLIFLVWNRRGGVKKFILGVSKLVRGTVGRVSSSVAEALEEEKMAVRVDEFFNMLDFIWNNRRKMVQAIALSHVGWFFTIVPLYISAVALGYEIPFMYVLFVVPLGSIAGYMPLPGGLGSVEITLAIVLASLTALSLTQASAVALLYRICVYWFVLVLGGLSLSYLSVGMYEKGEAG